MFDKAGVWPPQKAWIRMNLVLPMLLGSGPAWTCIYHHLHHHHQIINYCFVTHKRRGVLIGSFQTWKWKQRSGNGSVLHSILLIQSPGLKYGKVLDSPGPQWYQIQPTKQPPRTMKELELHMRPNKIKERRGRKIMLVQHKPVSQLGTQETLTIPEN